MTGKPLCVTLMGPTASGKTDLAVALAERLPMEIISVDSALVYRGMDIGTAKPDAATLARAPHHLIDIVEPTENYSAGRFRADATSLIADIHARGRIPLLVGGTMLYFRALKHGLDDLPGADPSLRSKLDARAVREGWPALHAELARLDPVTAARLAPNDAQRIQRALEVCLMAGQPLSALHRGASASERPWRLLELALTPSDRAWLRERIDTRFRGMLDAGLVDELRGLRARHPLSPDMASMRCVGYRQAWQYLKGEIDEARLLELGSTATRQLAKRQLTWLRGWQDAAVIDALDAGRLAKVIEHVVRCAGLPTDGQ